MAKRKKQIPIKAEPGDKIFCLRSEIKDRDVSGRPIYKVNIGGKINVKSVIIKVLNKNYYEINYYTKSGVFSEDNVFVDKDEATEEAERLEGELNDRD